MTFYSALLDYNPDPAELETKFRKWHVEPLLNQAADLLDKCLEEEKEYRFQLFKKLQFDLDLQSELDSIALDEKRRDERYFQREKEISELEIRAISDTDQDFRKSVNEAQSVSSLQDRENQGLGGWGRANQNLAEKGIEATERAIKTEILTRRGRWADEDENNAKDQIAYRRALHQHKRDALSVGGAFDLSKPIEELERRLARNYQDGYDRLKVAKVGLEQIYSYESTDLPNKEENLITDLVIWTRNAIEWLAAYQQRDQGFTRVISIRSLLSKDEWANLGQNAVGRMTEVFLSIPNSYFDKYENVRLRGIGASIIGTAGLYPWTMSVKVPDNALFYRTPRNIAGEVFTINPRPIDQSEMPRCWLGKVENRKSPRPIEVCGLVSIMNASPVGQIIRGDKSGYWSIQINSPSVPDHTSASETETFAGIDDIILELNVIGIPIE